MRHNHRRSPRPPASFLTTSTSVQRKTYDPRYKRYCFPPRTTPAPAHSWKQSEMGPAGPIAGPDPGESTVWRLRTRKGLPGAGDDPPPLSRVQKRRVTAAGWGPARALGQSLEPASSLPRSPRALGSPAHSSR